MPNIKGIDLSDGVKILSGEIGISDALITKAEMLLHKIDWSIEKIENFCNDWLENKIPNEQIRVHIFSLEPLRYTAMVTDPDAIVPDDWWAE